MPLLLPNSYISFVNLDHRKDRLERMEASLIGAGLLAVRTRGMLPSEYMGDLGQVKMMQNRTPGAIGCHFSQVSIMEKALELNKHAFVMEDDLIFCDDLRKRMDIINDFTSNHEWDVIWMGGTFHVGPPHWDKNILNWPNRPVIGRDAETTLCPHMMRTYGAFCTYAYIVNVRSIYRVMLLLEAGLSKSIGIDYLFIQLQHQLKTFAFVPGCITQYDNKSDIGNGMTIFSNFGKLNGTKENSTYWFQKRMEDFDPTKFNWKEASV